MMILLPAVPAMEVGLSPATMGFNGERKWSCSMGIKEAILGSVLGRIRLLNLSVESVRETLWRWVNLVLTDAMDMLIKARGLVRSTLH